MNRPVDPARLGPVVTGLALAAAALSVWSMWWAIPTVLLAFAAGRLPGRARATALVIVGVLAAAVTALAIEPAWIPLGFRFLALLLAETMLPWFAGRFWRQYRELAEAGREGARLRERARIAADMHDVLGHELSLIALSAGALKLAPGLSADHRAAVGEIRARAEAAVDRLGEVVGVLRPGEGDGEPAPATIEGLVEGARAAGMEVVLRADDLAALPLRAAVAARHVVQEALTNAARHAPGEPVTIDLRHGSDTTEIIVTNATKGPGAETTAPGGGHGLPNLTARVAAAGGRLTAGATPTGFTVRARLPHDPASEREPEPAPPRQLGARRRIRVTVAAAVLVPLLTFATVGGALRGWELLSVRGSVLAAEVFDGLRHGQDRAEFAHLLPTAETPSHPSPPEPPGTDCEYYEITSDPFDDRSGDAYRLCFDGTTLVSADIVSEEATA